MKKNCEMDRSFKNLIVYQRAYKLALQVFQLTKTFPAEEKYSLTDQIRRSSRSVCSNIAEGYRKRRYPKHFTSKMTDADGECSETLVWIDFAGDFGYISSECKIDLIERYSEVGKILGSMADHPEKFSIK